MTARQFGRDTGDTYGRHALVNPGGDNVQRDVLHVIDHWIHPTLVADGYAGRHRVDDRTFATVSTPAGVAIRIAVNA